MVGRLQKDRFLLDVRTLHDNEIPLLARSPLQALELPYEQTTCLCLDTCRRMGKADGASMNKQYCNWEAYRLLPAPCRYSRTARSSAGIILVIPRR